MTQATRGISKARWAGCSTGDDEGCWGVRGAKAGACLQPAGKAAPPELTLHPATSPFCAWAGRGQQGPGRGPLPQAPGGLGVPLGHPRAPARHISGPLGTSEGFSGTTPGGVKGLQSSWNDR